MTVYTVHQPPLRKGATAVDPDRFVFVRDGFYFWAFLLGPLWMLWRRLWLVLFLYVIGMAAVQTALWALGMSDAVKLAVGVLIGLLIGFEAASLQRWTLARRGWVNIGLVVAPDLESAERRFFDSWVERQDRPLAPTGTTAIVPPPARTPAGSDVVGLFPEPHNPR